MSKLGKRLIPIPQGVTAKFEGTKFSASGPKGSAELAVDSRVKVVIDNNQIKVSVASVEDTLQRAMWGTMWSLIRNVIQGVSVGFEKQLEVVGVGYRVQADKKKITLNVGYSHPVELAIPEGIEVTVEKNVITIRGLDKQQVGQFAALVRSQREPEPYKGKGIKYSTEVVRRKAGKVMKTAGG